MKDSVKHLSQHKFVLEKQTVPMTAYDSDLGHTAGK